MKNAIKVLQDKKHQKKNSLKKKDDCGSTSFDILLPHCRLHSGVVDAISA
jgi:hypothetical protein